MPVSLRKFFCVRSVFLVCFDVRLVVCQQFYVILVCILVLFYAKLALILGSRFNKRKKSMRNVALLFPCASRLVTYFSFIIWTLVLCVHVIIMLHYFFFCMSRMPVYMPFGRLVFFFFAHENSLGSLRVSAPLPNVSESLGIVSIKIFYHYYYKM